MNPVLGDHTILASRANDRHSPGVRVAALVVLAALTVGMLGCVAARPPLVDLLARGMAGEAGWAARTNGSMHLISAEARLPATRAVILAPIRMASPTRDVTPTPTSTQMPSPAPTATPLPIPITPDSTGASDRRTVIGYSVLGRPLEVVRFGNGPVERMIVAGIHGGVELNTIELADQLIAYVTSHPELVPADMTLWVLRALNPDGEAKGRFWSARGNANEVDLNRNFPAVWVPDWDRNGCWDYMTLNAGSGPGSEPETQALMRFLLAHPVDALISYHSAALGIFPGGQPPSPESLSLAAAISAVSDYPYPPIDIGCIYTGQLIDWASDHGIAAVDVELTNDYDTDFEQNLAILAALLSWRPKADGVAVMSRPQTLTPSPRRVTD